MATYRQRFNAWVNYWLGDLGVALAELGYLAFILIVVSLLIALFR